ncbi:MAG TPA: hypothetical protein VMT68_09135 [Caulobacteraceae bacterium]|nr:hypothetical protein [Caulobacteraceae bacterium]
MTSATRVFAAAFAAFLAFAGSAAVARPKPPPVIYAPPPPPPMPDVGFGMRFLDQAAAYQTYVGQATAISPAFGDPAAVADALRTGVAYEPEQLRRGAIVYAAVAALGDRQFVDAVRAAGQTPEQRYAIIAKLFADPRQVLMFAGAAQAEALAKAALAQSGMKLFSDGDAVRLAAYSIQHQPWSLTEVANRDQRASAVKQLSSTPRQPSADDRAVLERFIQGIAPAPAQPADPAAPPYSAMVVRAVALAALASIGQAGDDDFAHLGWLTDDYYLDHCLAETKLSLYECLAVAKPNYEDVFCLGQHAMKDTGACLVKSAYATVPIDIMTKPMVIPTAHIRKGGAHPTRRRRS